mmetsp:Transcript_46706/g.120948  ORF Transcript_46706/g.120948 Transcript_46706/m.120948 type:complete len:210 (+) Transcript_46706:597-1226(+)
MVLQHGPARLRRGRDHEAADHDAPADDDPRVGLRLQLRLRQLGHRLVGGTAGLLLPDRQARLRRADRRAHRRRAGRRARRRRGAGHHDVGAAQHHAGLLVHALLLARRDLRAEQRGRAGAGSVSAPRRHLAVQRGAGVRRRRRRAGAGGARLAALHQPRSRQERAEQGRPRLVDEREHLRQRLGHAHRGGGLPQVRRHRQGGPRHGPDP